MSEQIEIAPTQPEVWSEPIAEQLAGIPPDLCGPVNWNHPCSAQIRVLDPLKAIVAPVDGRKRSKVCIVGYAPNSRHLAWYNDPDCEIWGVNQVSRFIPREDRHFQIHKDWEDAAHWAPNTDQRKWIETAPIPTYMIAHDPSLQNSVTFPVEWVKEQLGLAGDKDIPNSGLDYFTSSIAFMYALAIAEGFSEIGIYGIDLIIGREYFFEKSCVEFYMGMAHAKGISIHRPENSALLWQSHRYGYEMAPDYGFYGLTQLEKRKNALQTEVTKQRDLVNVCDGRLKEAEVVVAQLGEPAKSEYAVRVEELRKALDKQLNVLFVHDGAFQEVSRMHAILEIKSRGGEVHPLE